MFLFFFTNNISRISDLFNVADILVCSPTSIGKSFHEWTIKSHLSLINSSLRSFVNTPSEGISDKGVTKSLSPDVLLVTYSISISGNLDRK